ncbi:GNAT family N-acetyltransferase [Parendozoicomonas haliclonae]|uniref:Aminoalkylphosphonic acid N-acetyltransferase n=1 Tax=Parendozoicomonas haliclonae TaxID=1960125 RepID=A0A1X7ARV6_9GAMM|nr:GNAT family N-acetyltransferase [Parendozoicomonas haliclonae]SMA50838.1 aminoalkylphosphonic acid N-acetyltransferase [Parendozoicomonas haliclonae]
MNNTITILPAQPADADTLARLAFAMESELWDGETGERTEQDYRDACHALLEQDNSFWALLAKDEQGQVIGMITISLNAALYAGGYFGEIMELYVEPEWRSQGIGQQLITAARQLAEAKSWPFLEVGAPPQPRWQKTLAFYQQQGFREIGPRLELVTERP